MKKNKNTVIIVKVIAGVGLLLIAAVVCVAFFNGRENEPSGVVQEITDPFFGETTIVHVEADEPETPAVTEAPSEQSTPTVAATEKPAETSTAVTGQSSSTGTSENRTMESTGNAEPSATKTPEPTTRATTPPESTPEPVEPTAEPEPTSNPLQDTTRNTYETEIF